MRVTVSMRRVFLLAFLVVLQGSQSWSAAQGEPARSEATYTVQSGIVETRIRYRCQRWPIERTSLYFPRSGVVQSVCVRQGESVREGQILISLEDLTGSIPEEDRALRAPSAGKVVEVLCQPGMRVVGLGVFASPSTAMTFAPEGPSRFECTVDPAEAERLKSALRVVLESGDDSFLAVQAAFEPAGARTVRVVVNTAGPEQEAAIASEAYASFIMESHEGLRVPVSALVLRSGQVGVRKGSEFVPVSLGLVGEAWAEVKEGLSQGEEILSAPEPEK